MTLLQLLERAADAGVTITIYGDNSRLTIVMEKGTGLLAFKCARKMDRIFELPSLKAQPGDLADHVVEKYIDEMFASIEKGSDG